MKIPEAKRQTRLGEWAQHIRDQQGSGMTIKAWCAAHGYREGRYYYWLKLVREAAIKSAGHMEQSRSLIRVEPEQLPSSVSSESITTGNQESGIIIRYGNVTVEYSAGTPATDVAELLKALYTP